MCHARRLELGLRLLLLLLSGLLLLLLSLAHLVELLLLELLVLGKFDGSVLGLLVLCSIDQRKLPLQYIGVAGRGLVHGHVVEAGHMGGLGVIGGGIVERLLLGRTGMHGPGAWHLLDAGLERKRLLVLLDLLRALEGGTLHHLGKLK